MSADQQVIEQLKRSGVYAALAARVCGAPDVTASVIGQLRAAGVYEALLAHVAKDGEGNPNHDETGRFSSGDGGGGGGDGLKGLSREDRAAKVDALEKSIGVIQDSMNDVAGDVDSALDDISNAISTDQDIDAELEQEEEFAEPADQQDWEDRMAGSANDIQAAVKEAKAKLEKMIQKAQAHMAALDAALK